MLANAAPTNPHRTKVLPARRTNTRAFDGAGRDAGIAMAQRHPNRCSRTWQLIPLFPAQPFFIPTVQTTTERPNRPLCPYQLNLKQYNMKVTTLIALGTLLGSSAFVAAQDAPAAPTRPARTPRAPTAEQIKEFDKNGDGKLDETEMKAMQDARRAKYEAMQKANLEKYDANKNGKLDPEEIAKMRADREAELIKKYDKDGDGKLSDEEKKAIPASERMGMGSMGGPGGRTGTGGRRGGAPTTPPAAPAADPAK